MPLVSARLTPTPTSFPPSATAVNMTFDLLSRFRRPVPTRDARGHHHPQRPPPMTTTHVHAKRPGLVPHARPPARRVHHRDQHQPGPMPVPRPFVPPRKVARAPVPPRRGLVMRAPAPSRKGPIVRAPPRPHPPPRAPSRLLDYLHINFHPKRDLALAPPRSSKSQAPPFPPPRGAMKAPPRRVHWAPAQAALPSQPYPYPSHASSRTTTSYATSHRSHPSPPAIPRYQPPAQLPRGVVLVPHRRK